MHSSDDVEPTIELRSMVTWQCLAEMAGDTGRIEARSELGLLVKKHPWNLEGYPCKKSRDKYYAWLS